MNGNLIYILLFIISVFIIIFIIKTLSGLKTIDEEPEQKPLEKIKRADIKAAIFRDSPALNLQTVPFSTRSAILNDLEVVAEKEIIDSDLLNGRFHEALEKYDQSLTTLSLMKNFRPEEGREINYVELREFILYRKMALALFHIDGMKKEHSKAIQSAEERMRAIVFDRLKR